MSFTLHRTSNEVDKTDSYSQTFSDKDISQFSNLIFYGLFGFLGCGRVHICQILAVVEADYSYGTRNNHGDGWFTIYLTACGNLRKITYK